MAGCKSKECYEPASCVKTNPATGAWTSSPGCMEFNTDNMIVNAGPGLMQIAHNGVNSLFTWAQKPDGVGFEYLPSRAIPAQAIEPIRYGKDYFLLASATSNMHYLEVLHFNGQAITKIQEIQKNASNEGNSPYETFRLNGHASGGNYFISKYTHPGASNPLTFWKKVVTRDAIRIPFHSVSQSIPSTHTFYPTTAICMNSISVSGPIPARFQWNSTIRETYREGP